jgi:2-polyprenyl-3-methyl-5-hydroxy-6-metoxy-1,4-benzoquinol methylase
MENFDRKQHWEKIYQTKPLQEVSWYQPKPETSLNLITGSFLPKEANIIDIGGGDSLLSDHLLELGYSHLTVLDISSAAIERAKKRLGPDAEKVNWIEADVAAFAPQKTYDLWHDRAAFHFLREEKDIKNYIQAVNSGVKPGGYLIIGTFGPAGPLKCSGIEIKQYSQEEITALFAENFVTETCMYVDHTTLSGGNQQFTFCRLKRK